MRIWVTRTQPEAEATGGRLRALGHAPLVAPVLEVRDVPGDIDLDGVGALAFTSRNGATAFAARSAARDLPVFAVGGATADAARGLGFVDVRSADGDVGALAELIAAGHDPARGHVLHPGAAEPAQDLAGALKRKGVKARWRPVYEAAALDLPDAICAALTADPIELDAVIIHSPRAARRIAELLDSHEAARGLIALCISAAAARPLAPLGLREIRVASRPDEAALLDLLAQ